jgi:hypothetical protein
VIASPALIRVACHTPHQMRLANALCRLVEVAAQAPGTSERVLAADAGSLPAGPHGGLQLSWLDGSP